MTGSQSFVARGVLAACSSVAAVVVCRRPWVLRMPWKGFFRTMVVSFVAWRMLLFVTLYGLLHFEPRGDVIAYYLPEAMAVLHGKVPNIDIPSSYAPLHPYLDAVLLRLWFSPLSLILFSITAEILLFALAMKLAQEVFREDQVRIASVLYLCSAISLQFVTIDGQDTVLASLALICAMWLLHRDRYIFSGMALGLSIAAVKFLPLLFVPLFVGVLLAGAPGVKRQGSPVMPALRWLLGFSLLTVPVYGIAALRKVSILMPLRLEGGSKSAGNLPYLVESTFGIVSPALLWDVVTLLVLSALLWILFRKYVSLSIRADSGPRTQFLMAAAPALTLALLIFAKKSWSSYLILCLFPLCLTILQKGRAGSREWSRQIGLFAAFSFGVVMFPSYWSSMICRPEAPNMCQPKAPTLHRLLSIHLGTALAFVPMQIAFLAGLGYYAGKSCMSVSTEGEQEAVLAPK